MTPSARKMGPRLLIWGVIAFIMVPGGETAELCENDPPEITHATFKALAYKKRTTLNCECKRGYRRIKSGSPYMRCAGNSSHSFWDSKCQCVSSAPQNRTKGVAPQPGAQRESPVSGMLSPTQPVDHASLPGHCREPPRWEHEATKRIYHFVVGQMVHYQCVQGYRALQRGPAQSVCEVACGKTRWTRPRLTCVDETEPSPFPGEEAFQTSREDLPERETSCPLTTTDYQEYTEAATTKETFPFTTEYQVAVAGCVFLLFTILLLSGFTWQRRRRKSRRTI
ncbi:interleukin-2 receptor subunit alpha [Nycticebus coucang]|uniref:interleukin-2 receptor subunit alpha n=1 Tax=Nycticebus coucang TaxID=9470 RepID=UPI00234E031B|nr:interleukin-2 receptor subunit alpha [Nycticebus coucang]